MKKDISEFESHVVRVDIRKTCLMDNALREVDKRSAEMLFKELFQDGMYGLTESKISVALVGVEGWDVVKSVVEKHGGSNEFSVDKYFPENTPIVIDGQHRRHVLLHPDVLPSINPIVPAYLYTRKDGAPMSQVDCLWLGYALNHRASLVKEMTPVDHVHSALSFVKAIVSAPDHATNKGPSSKYIKMAESSLFDQRAKGVMKLFTELKVLPHGKTLMRQYANIVAGLLPYPEAYSVVSKLFSTRDSSECSEHDGEMKRSIPLSKIQFRAIWDSPDDEDDLVFRIRAVFFYFNEGKSTSDMSKEEHYREFVRCMNLLRSYIGVRLEFFNIDMYNLFQMDIPSEGVSVGEYFCRRCPEKERHDITEWYSELDSSLRFVMQEYLDRNTPSVHVKNRIKKWMETGSITAEGAIGGYISMSDKIQKENRNVDTLDFQSSPNQPQSAESFLQNLDCEIDVTAAQTEYVVEQELAVLCPAVEQEREAGISTSQGDALVEQEPTVPPLPVVMEEEGNSPAAQCEVVVEEEPTVPSPGAELEEEGDTLAVQGNVVLEKELTVLSTIEVEGDNNEKQNRAEQKTKKQARVGQRKKAAKRKIIESDTEEDTSRDEEYFNDHDGSEAGDALDVRYEAPERMAYLLEDGSPGTFEISFKSLPNTGTTSTPTSFVQMKIAQAVGSVCEKRPLHDVEAPVDDLYMDGFRVVSETEDMITYRLPQIRCGFRAEACLFHIPTGSMWINEAEDAETEEWVPLFRDEIPSAFPLKHVNISYLKRSVFNWKRQPSVDFYPPLVYLRDWEKLTSGMPVLNMHSKQHIRVVIDQFMWLRSLGLRPPHRSFFVLGEEDLERIYESTFLHAHTALHPGKEISEFDVGCVQGWFRSKRTEIDLDGFCILPGFLSDSLFELEENKSSAQAFRLPSTRGTYDRHQPCDAKALFSFYESSMPQAAHIKNGRKNLKSAWSTICNENDGKDGSITDAARFTTTAYAMTTFIEKAAENLPVVAGRAELDVRILQASKFLRLRYCSFDDVRMSAEYNSLTDPAPHPPSLYVPDSGGRFLATGKKCGRQVAHCDYTWYEKSPGNTHTGLSCPGYFTIATGPASAPLWILRGSHRLIWKTSEQKRKIEEGLQMEKIVIPPWSIFFGRGDLTHAGGAYSDGDEQERKNGTSFLRYHLYLVRENVPLRDALSFQADLDPFSSAQGISNYISKPRAAKKAKH